MGDLENMKTWKDPYKSENYADFTLTPAKRVDSATLMRRIDHYMGNTMFSRMVGDAEVLAADFLRLPSVGAAHPELRHKLAELREEISSGQDISDTAESLSVMLEDESEFPEIVEVFDELLHAHEVLEGKRMTVVRAGDGMVWTATEVPVQSESNKEVTYTVRGEANDEKESDIEWKCDCPGNRRWSHCYHADKVAEAVAALENSS